MKRTIQKWVDDALTDALLLSPKSGSHFILSYDSENEVTKVDVKVKKKKKRDE